MACGHVRGGKAAAQEAVAPVHVVLLLVLVGLRVHVCVCVCVCVCVRVRARACVVAVMPWFTAVVILPGWQTSNL